MLKLTLHILAFTACSFAADATAVERGRREFVQSCGFCHGNDARGSRAPDLIRSPLPSHDENGETTCPVIRNGRPEKEMPAFPNAHVGDIAAFLHDEAKAALNSANVPREYPLEKLLTGNSGAGRIYFESHCRSCHSPGGDLKGVAKKYSPIELQSRFLYPAGVKPTAVITLPSGEQATGTVAHTDEFTIAIRDGSGWHRSWRRDAVKIEIHDPLSAPFSPGPSLRSGARTTAIIPAGGTADFLRSTPATSQA